MNSLQTTAIICGKGRLGQLIVAALQQQGICCEYARIDPLRGLIQKDEALNGLIDTLILCFVPEHTTEKSGWQDLLCGLLNQVQSGTLKIQRVLFISSTAVYEEIETGIVDINTRVTGSSIRAQGLLSAENIISKLSVSSAIFRLTGLVGPGYNKYDPITYSNDKPRQAVDTRAVASKVLKWFLQRRPGHTVDVLTDGIVYWQGKKWDVVQDAEEIETLSKKFRLLKPSVICCDR